MKSKLLVIAGFLSAIIFAFAADNDVAVPKWDASKIGVVKWKTTDTDGVHVQHIIVDSGGGGGAVTVAQLPASLGIKTSAASLSVAPSSDGVFPVTGTFWQATQPVSIATAPVLVAGSALIGKVGIDQTTAGSTNAVQTKQYAGVPSNFAVATADGTVFTLAAGEIGFIQNLDSADALAVKKGASASTSSFSFILKAGSAADDGNGGYTQINDWVGAVSVATMSGTGRYIAWKQAP